MLWDSECWYQDEKLPGIWSLLTSLLYSNEAQSLSNVSGMWSQNCQDQQLNTCESKYGILYYYYCFCFYHILHIFIHTLLHDYRFVHTFAHLIIAQHSPICTSYIPPLLPACRRTLIVFYSLLFWISFYFNLYFYFVFIIIISRAWRELQIDSFKNVIPL